MKLSQHSKERISERTNIDKGNQKQFFRAALDKGKSPSVLKEEKKIPEKLNYVHPDISCSYNESELLLRIEANKDKINEILDYLDYFNSKGDE